LPDGELRNRGALLGYLGTSEQPVRVRLLEGRDRIGPGSSGTARIWLARPAPLLPGDRFVLRDSGRAMTVAGGEVLDVHPVLQVSKARPDGSVERLVAERGWVDVDELSATTGVRVEANVGRWVVSEAAVRDAKDRLDGLLDRAGPEGVDVATLDERLRSLVHLGEGLVLDRGRVRRAGAALDDLADHPWLRALEAEPFAPPPPDGVPRAEVRDLVRRGLVVEEDGLFFAVAAVEAARRAVVGALAASTEGLTMSALRELLGTSRKFAVPLAAILDRRGITVRRGDVRLAGRRLDWPVEIEPV
jgi:selenocysteine-specific elongation factor